MSKYSFFQIVLALDPLFFHVNFRVHLPLSVKMLAGMGIDCTESEDLFGQNYHLITIESL